MTEKKQGSQVIVDSLLEEGVDVIFGFPGGRVIPLYDKLYNAPIKHYLTRHEQGAVHAADGYARVTGRVGVCIATSGPGATNLVTGLATANMDSVPLVALTGQVPVSMIGNDSFQEADTFGITIPVTKHNYLLKDTRMVQQVIREAFHIASTGRPGPVAIDIPSNLQTESFKPLKVAPPKLPGYQPIHKGHPKQISAALTAIENSRRPVIYAGGGVITSGAAEEVKKFVDQTRIPITTTLMGKGAYPEDAELSLGMLGMHGTKYANHAIYESDLILAFGARFDDRVAGDVAKFAPLAKVVHVDIDAAEIGKRVAADIPVVGDLKEVVRELTQKVKKTVRQEWLDKVAEWKRLFPLTYEDDGRLKPQYIIETLSEMTRGEAVVATDVGQHQMWAAQYYKCSAPRRFVTSGGLGTMGYGFPAAIGAQIGRPDLPTVCLSGDGSFQMCIQELAAVRQYNLPVKIFILNNGCLGMVRQWQQFFCESRYSQTVFEYGPDFCTIADGYEVPNRRVSDPKDAREAVDQALNTDGPMLIDFRVFEEENVLPMIPPNAGQTEFYGEEE